MEKRIRIFFEQHILPLHEQALRDNKDYLDMNFGQPTESYFSEPQHPAYLYLNNVSFQNASHLTEYLNEFWKDEPQLQKLVPDLVKLAFELKEEEKEQSAELSPFVYAMF